MLTCGSRLVLLVLTQHASMWLEKEVFLGSPQTYELLISVHRLLTVCTSVYSSQYKTFFNLAFAYSRCPLLHVCLASFSKFVASRLQFLVVFIFLCFRKNLIGHFCMGGKQMTSQSGETGTALQPSLMVQLRQFVIAMIVMDTWQYFVHRYMHHNKFLYRHVHSQHHKLIVPYAFGALYNHPLEGLLLDTVGGAISFIFSGMTPRTSIFFFSFATIKTVDDHCGLWLPGNPFHILFQNNSAYHDIHHQLYGTKYNFSQPFFVMWDKILGTYMPYTVLKRAGGGLEARPTKTE